MVIDLNNVFSRRHPTLEYQLSDTPNPQFWQMIVNRLGLDRQQAGVMAMLVLAIMFAFIGSGLLRESALDPLKKAENDLGGSSFWFLLSAFSLYICCNISIFSAACAATPRSHLLHSTSLA